MVTVCDVINISKIIGIITSIYMYLNAALYTLNVHDSVNYT